MDEMLVVVFDNENQAYDGAKALQDLQNEGRINLYAKAVAAKDTNGKASIKAQGDGGPVGTLVGLLAGSLFGVPLGPLGVVLGAGAGTTGGLVYDLVHYGVSQDYLEEIEQYLKPGKAAVIAEVFGEGTAPVDECMKALGGAVFRYPRSQVLDYQIKMDIAALEADLAGLKAGFNESTREAQARLQKRVDAARQRLQAEQDAIQAEIKESQKETEAKIKSLHEQADQANSERKARLEKHVAGLQADQKRRSDLLKQAWELIKKALSGE